MPSERLRLAVFAEPVGELAAFIEACKARVRRDFPDAVYLNHPPHTTLFVADVDNPATAAAKITQSWASRSPRPSDGSRAEDFPAIPRPVMAAHRWHVFARDTLAADGDTLVIKLTPDPAWWAWQLRIAETFRRARIGLTTAPAPFSGGPLRESWERYGWPFVGAHWLPHATIASLPAQPASRARQIIEELCRLAPPDGGAIVTTLALVAVRGDRHEAIGQLDLKEYRF
ncbi:MAG: hypothetical protein SFZ23_09480 [Planctomycetota bacterium]|nr:hypothetical protein [Planctomycetota bacterium]